MKVATISGRLQDGDGDGDKGTKGRKAQASRWIAIYLARNEQDNIK